MAEQRGGMKHTHINKKGPGQMLLFCIIACIAVFFSSTAVFSNQTGLMDRIKTANRKMDKTKQTDTVISLPKNIVRVNDAYQGGGFYTRARKNEIKRFKCSACHNNQEVSIRNAAAISHADIKINHGGKDTPLACNTCHNKNDRDFLTTAKADKIDMDHVYEMCGQCHFRQKKDWIGGAHGKRVMYWAGERVVENCTSCHDPHAPRFEKRWPATYSVPLK